MLGTIVAIVDSVELHYSSLRIDCINTFTILADIQVSKLLKERFLYLHDVTLNRSSNKRVHEFERVYMEGKSTWHITYTHNLQPQICVP